jgi:DHA1 family inner membrane transport protein
VRGVVSALTVAALGFGTTEFAMMGLLPVISSGLGVSLPETGHLIAGYALGVVVGAPLLTAVTVRLRAKTMLLVFVGVFAAGNALSAGGPGFGALLLARFLTGLPHGAFFGLGSLVAAELAPAGHRTRAIAAMFAGLTASNILGVPLITFLGTHLGWRASFWAISGVGLVSMALILALVPATVRPPAASLSAELRVLGRPQVLLSMSVAVFGSGGMFAMYSYISPLLVQVSGFGTDVVPALLMVFGLGMTAGSLLAGRLASRTTTSAICAFLSLSALLLSLFSLTAHIKALVPVTLFLVGVFGFALIPALQTRIIQVASQAPVLASAAIHSGFNTANALGAVAGGAVISAGFGYTSPSMVGAGFSVVGLILMVLTARAAAAARPAQRPPAGQPARPGGAMAAQSPSCGSETAAHLSDDRAPGPPSM